MSSNQQQPPHPLAKIPRKKARGKTEIIEQHFAIKAAKSWKPSAQQFSRLGFDSLSFTPNLVRLRKVQSTDILGRPHLFVEIEISKDGATLRYSCPPESDAGVRRMQACLLLMQLLYLLPGVLLEAKSVSELALPSLEMAGRTAGEPYESLLKSKNDLQDELSEASLQNRRLLRAAEESAAECAALRKQANSLAERVAQLERVPDAALDEMMLDWLSSHRGAMNMTLFSRANNVPVARCEERLAALLKRGAIRKTAGSFQADSAAAASQGSEFRLRKGRWDGLKAVFNRR